MNGPAHNETTRQKEARWQMPNPKRKQVRNGHLWKVTSNPDCSVVNVRVGSKIVAQVPGPVRSMIRLDGQRLLLTFLNHAPLMLDLFTGEVQVVKHQE